MLRIIQVGHLKQINELYMYFCSHLSMLEEMQMHLVRNKGWSASTYPVFASKGGKSNGEVARHEQMELHCNKKESLTIAELHTHGVRARWLLTEAASCGLKFTISETLSILCTSISEPIISG